MSDRPTTIRVDGRDLPFRAGESLLALARRAGSELPSLCQGDGLPAEGGCRLCLVALGPEERLVASCHTPAEPGMQIVTRSERLDDLRRRLLELWISTTESTGLHADPRAESSELGHWMQALGVAAPPRHGTPAAAAHSEKRSPEDRSHPYVWFDRDRCITCRRCQHACEEVQGQFVFGIDGRGPATRLVYGAADRLDASPCVACGACVDACPTGALHDAAHAPTPAPESSVQSTCGYCGVGCQIDVGRTGDRIVEIRAPADAAVNRGHLCVKGRYAHGYRRHRDRLTMPLRRGHDGLHEISWEEAIRWLAERLGTLHAESGPDALGAFTSSRSTNEAAYLLQKLFRARLGSNHVDCCARVCHSSTALALQTVTGTGAASACYDDIEQAGCIVVAGANPTEAHPVLGARIRQAALRGARLIVVDPRRIELVRDADVHLALRPGTNVALFHALAHALWRSGRIDRRYLEERVEGLDAYRDFIEAFDTDRALRTAGVDREAVDRASEILGEAGPTLFVHGLGLSELTQGTESVMTLCNLGMLTGSIGRPGAGMLPLRGQNNVQGNADMGGMPDQVTGYQRVSDPEVRRHVESLWGRPLPDRAGLTTTEMLDAARAGRIRGVWMQGEDAAQSDPNQSRVIEALERLDLLVVQDLFLSETARFAHLVLPAAGALEQDGTFTNGERRIQRVRAAVAPPGEARPDWEVVRDVGVAMGEPWRYPTAGDVMDEIARVAPRLFGGVCYERLEGDGLQWPCPDRSHPGTRTVHADGFLRGRGQLVTPAFRPSPEHDVEGYPFLLVTGRILDHYNVGTMTRRTPSRELVGEDWLEMHPDDATRCALAEGDRVALESRWGRTRVRVRPSARIAPGTLFLTFHFPESHTNRLTGPQLDPDSKCPEYKVTAVRLAGGPAAAQS